MDQSCSKHEAWGCAILLKPRPARPCCDHSRPSPPAAMAGVTLLRPQPPNPTCCHETLLAHRQRVVHQHQGILLAQLEHLVLSKGPWWGDSQSQGSGGQWWWVMGGGSGSGSVDDGGGG